MRTNTSSFGVVVVLVLLATLSGGCDVFRGKTPGGPSEGGPQTIPKPSGAQSMWALDGGRPFQTGSTPAPIRTIAPGNPYFEISLPQIPGETIVTYGSQEPQRFPRDGKPHLVAGPVEMDGLTMDVKIDDGGGKIATITITR